MCRECALLESISAYSSSLWRIGSSSSSIRDGDGFAIGKRSAHDAHGGDGLISHESLGPSESLGRFADMLRTIVHPF